MEGFPRRRRRQYGRSSAAIPALGGLATMKQLAGHMGSPQGPAIAVTLYMPNAAAKPVPALVSITFNFAGLRGRGRGPASTNTAPAKAGTTNAANAQVSGGTASTNVPGRGGFGSRGTPLELISNHFAYASIIYNSIETDAQGQTNVNLARKLALAPGQTVPAADQWGAIAAWAWGISRFVDYLETEHAVDAKRVAITGVSRLGKTVLWAGANDPRIALVIASCSGEGGAALARRDYGETIAHLVAPSRYPYQFAGNYAKYGPDPNKLAVDTHCLIAPDGAPARIAANRQHGPLVRPERRIPCRSGGPARVRVARQKGASDRPVSSRRPVRRRHARLLHARRRTRHGSVRLGRVPEVHENAIEAWNIRHSRPHFADDKSQRRGPTVYPHRVQRLLAAASGYRASSSASK